jgi:diguanylate cyclase (GGDEF)-like protein/PAS domain S-box-containing protein
MPEAAENIPEDGWSREETERVCIRNLLASSEERVYFKDLDSRFLLVSAGWLKAEGQGRSLEGVIGKTDFDMFTSEHAIEAFADEQRIIRTGEPLVGKVERETYPDRLDAWVSTTKLPLRDEAGQVIGTFGISRDVTAQIEAQNALAYHALHDSVTGLPNRAALMDRLMQALVTLETRPGRLGLMFLDVDDFKSINDRFGHEVGDQVLTEIGRRLTGVTHRRDTVCRFGGDELVVLCPALGGDEDLREIGERMMQALRVPLHAAGAGGEIVVTGSLGAVLTSDPAADPGELLQQADFAMYAAKHGGRNRVETYDEVQHAHLASTRGLAAELRRAIDHSELFVLYQPVFRLADRSISGLEALARWRHPERGIVPPAEWIPLAEQHGLIAEVDAFVLDEACRQLAAWTRSDASWEACTMAVNLSGRQLRDASLVERVIGTLERHAITPCRLCLEITETAVIGELADAERVIAALSAYGVRIALDDFGTGYSTLSHLQSLRANIIKIDRSFVARITKEPRDREIIAAVTAMAHALGMTVVGEGIETDGDLAELMAVNCDQGQGFLFSEPLAPPQIARLWHALSNRRIAAVR